MRSFTTPIMVVSLVAACAGSNDKGGGRALESPAASSDSSASSKWDPRRAKLAPAPSSLSLGQFWPTKICTRGPGVIVVSNSCACDSKMTCSVTRRGGVLDLHVAMTQELCKDCGTFAATCNVPPDARSVKTFRITIDGKPALEAIELPRSNAPSTERCYD